MSKFLVIIFIFFCNSAFAQNNYINAFKCIDSLTKNESSYSIKVLVNDSLIKNYNPVVAEISRKFTFLKGKKITSQNPEFVITINITTNLQQEPKWRYNGKDGSGIYEGTMYQITSQYIYNAILLMQTKSGANYSSVIASGLVLETSVNKKIYDKPEQVIFLKDKPFTENSLYYFIDSYSANFKREVDLFMNDFKNLFEKYRTF